MCKKQVYYSHINTAVALEIHKRIIQSLSREYLGQRHFVETVISTTHNLPETLHAQVNGSVVANVHLDKIVQTRNLAIMKQASTYNLLCHFHGLENGELLIDLTFHLGSHLVHNFNHSVINRRSDHMSNHHGT